MTTAAGLRSANSEASKAGFGPDLSAPTEGPLSPPRPCSKQTTGTCEDVQLAMAWVELSDFIGEVGTKLQLTVPTEALGSTERCLNVQWLLLT